MDISTSLVSMNLWHFLLLLSIGIIWMLIAAFKPSEEKLRTMFGMGLFLAIFDLVFETIGLYLGYWQATNSLFLIGPAVPLEVFAIAICAGAAMNLLFSKFSWEFSVPAAFLIAAMGTWIEGMLVNTGNLVYLGGWTAFHAFAAYFIVFTFLQYVNFASFTKSTLKAQRVSSKKAKKRL